MNNHVAITSENSRSKELWYLFFTFFKIGCVAFGGHMALISVIQKEIIEKGKKIDEEDFLNAISIASLLPGPVAVNVVAYIGYTIQRKLGFAVSMLGILMPAVFLMFLISWCYFNLVDISFVAGLMLYAVAAVSAVILTVGLNLFLKEVYPNLLKIAICVVSAVALYFIKGYFIILLLLVVGGGLGFILKLGQQNLENDEELKWWSLSAISKISLAFIGVLYTAFATGLYHHFANIYAKVALVFSGVSLSLFGGGYVMIPIMQTLFVTELGWLNAQQFIDGIAFSQLTPGPILVSSVFIGYKIAGIWGGILGTIAIFLPSGLLMVIASKMFLGSNNNKLKHILAGVKPVVIGMIIASAATLLFSVSLSAVSFLFFVVAFVAAFKYKISPVYIISLALIVGLLIHFGGQFIIDLKY